MTYYVLFFLHVATRRIHVAGVTPHPDEHWMTQVDRNVDRDGTFCPAFDEIIRSAGVSPIKMPAQSPNLNPDAEWWVRLVKDECLSKLIFFGDACLRRALSQFGSHPAGSDHTRVEETWYCFQHRR